jgi:peroxiredoxin Q/BCP
LSALQDDKAKFEKANAMILGVNNNSVQAHQAYCGKRGFTFPILSDPELRMSKAYGAEKGGRIKRTVVVIGPDGKIAFHRSGMPTDDEILEAIS